MTVLQIQSIHDLLVTPGSQDPICFNTLCHVFDQQRLSVCSSFVSEKGLAQSSSPSLISGNCLSSTGIILRQLCSEYMTLPLRLSWLGQGDTGPKCAKLSLLESSNKEIGNMDNKLTHVNINLLQIQSVYWPEFFCYQQKDWLFSFIVMNIYYNMDNLENYWES